MDEQPPPHGMGPNDRFLGTLFCHATVWPLTAGPRVPLVTLAFTSSLVSNPDVHQAQPRLHLDLDQARQLAAQLLQRAQEADLAAGTSSAPRH